jgi:hypothetical protein
MGRVVAIDFRELEKKMSTAQPEADTKGASKSFELRPIGRIESDLRSLNEAPRQGDEGAPDVRGVVTKSGLETRGDVSAET